MTGAADGYPVDLEPLQPLRHHSGIMGCWRAVRFNGIADQNDGLAINFEPLLTAACLGTARAIEPPPR